VKVVRRLIIVALTAAVAGGGAAARASERVDVNATAQKLAVNSRGTALVTYRARGRTFHLLVWGAINALPPSQSVPQVHFRFDWSGGCRRTTTPCPATRTTSGRPETASATASPSRAPA